MSVTGTSGAVLEWLFPPPSEMLQLLKAAVNIDSGC